MIVLKILLTILKIIGILLLVLLGLIVLLGFVPVGVTAEYSEEGPEVLARIGPVKRRVFPRPKKAPATEQPAGEKKKKKPKKKRDESPEGEASPKEKPKQKLGGMIPLFRELLGTALRLLGTFRRKLWVKELILHLTVGGLGEDPAKAARLYGNAWAALGNLIPVIYDTVRVRKQDVGAEIDFTEPKNRIYAKATMTITIGAVLLMGIRYGVPAGWAFLKYKWKTRKAETINRSEETEASDNSEKGGSDNGTSSQ